jgi:hypothetical protein
LKNNYKDLDQSHAVVLSESSCDEDDSHFKMRPSQLEDDDDEIGNQHHEMVELKNRKTTSATTGGDN